MDYPLGGFALAFGTRRLVGVWCYQLFNLGFTMPKLGYEGMNRYIISFISSVSVCRRVELSVK
jgi:hypothetical protein